MLGNALEPGEPPPMQQLEPSSSPKPAELLPSEERPRLALDVMGQRGKLWVTLVLGSFLLGLAMGWDSPGAESGAASGTAATQSLDSPADCPPPPPSQQLPPPAVMSRSLRDATAPVAAVFIDFDGTLLNNNVFSEGLLARCQAECSCDCTAMTGAGSLAGFVSSVPLDDVRDAFGGAVRLQRLREFVAGLVAQNVRVRMLSTSWFPVDDDAWRSYLSTVAALVSLPFESDDIITVRDLGPGTTADKGAEIAERLTRWGLASHEALFVDDSSGNMESASTRHGYRICDTVWLPQRQGMSEAVLDYIETRVGGCCSWASVTPPLCPPPPPSPLPPATSPPLPVGAEMAVAAVTFAGNANAAPVTRAALSSAINMPVNRVGSLTTRRAVIAGTAELNGVHYFVWDDDRNSHNDLHNDLSGIDELRECCAEFGLRAVSWQLLTCGRIAISSLLFHTN